MIFESLDLPHGAVHTGNGEAVSPVRLPLRLYITYTMKLMIIVWDWDWENGKLGDRYWATGNAYWIRKGL